MFKRVILLFSLLLICFNQFASNNIEFDYENESFFAIIGLTGCGKSEFLNALAGEKVCETSNKGKSKTQDIQKVELVYKNNLFSAIDTPGLDDSNDDNSKIEIIKDLLIKYPKIKKLLLIKRYNEVRFPGSLQKALKIYMEAFPIKDFWEHVIVVNTFANPHDETFTDYMEEMHEKYVDKILECENLIEFMKSKGIDIPQDIKEYYVDSIKYKKYPEINDTLNKIKEDILLSKPMFKNVEKSPILESTRESETNKGFYIVKKYIEIIYTDFNGKKIYKQKVISEEEIAPKDCPIIKVEEKVEFEGWDLKFSDILYLFNPSLFLAKKFFKYNVYTINYYEVGDKIVKGDKIYKKTKFVSILDEYFETLLYYVDKDILIFLAKNMKNYLPNKIISFLSDIGVLESSL